MRTIEQGDVCPHCGEVAAQKALPHLLTPGSILKERYLIGYALGQGGFGITYIGCDLLLNMRVAVKEYYPTGYANRNTASSLNVTVTSREQADFLEAGKERFLREARVLAEFNDEEGIVDVRDFFEENNTAYIVMEYLDGVTLQQYLSTKRFPADELVNMLDPVMRALEKLHNAQVVHRDVSPDNIMVLPNGSMKLMDFGAAHAVSVLNEKSMTLVMKPGFAPSEQYRAKGELGPWTDVYALCATIYMCITGQRPEDALERAFVDEMKWPSELGVSISPSMEKVLQKGMAPDYRARYQTIGELRAAFKNEEHPKTDSNARKTVEKTDPDKTITEIQGEKKAPKKKRVFIAAGILLISFIAFFGIIKIVRTAILRAEKRELPEGTFTGYTVEEVGAFGQPDTGKLDISKNKLAVKHADSTFSVLTTVGQAVNEAQYSSIEQIRPLMGNDYSGYFMVRDPKVSGENNKGLIDNDGNLLIPCDTLYIDRIGTNAYSDRYLIVYYSTGTATDEDFFIDITNEAGKLHYYNGYARIFDLYNRCFVKDLQIKNNYTVCSCGDHFVVEEPGKTYTLYDCNGEKILQAKGNFYTGEGFVISRIDEMSYVYNEEGEILFSSEEPVYPVAEGSHYLKQDKPNGFVILDQNGEQVSPIAYENVFGEHLGLFSIEDNGKNELLASDQRTLYTADNSYTWITDRYWFINSDKHKQVLIGPNGEIGRKLPYVFDMASGDGKGDYFVINDGKYSLHLDDANAQKLTYGLISAKEKSGKYIVYDLFTGQKLLPAEYSKIMYASGYIYALDGATWHAFRLARVYK